MKNRTRILCILLTLCMLCMMAPANGLAAVFSHEEEVTNSDPDTPKVEEFSPINTGKQIGIHIKASDGGEVTATVTGDGSIAAKGVGAFIEAENGGEATLNSGDVTVNGENAMNDTIGIDVRNDDGDTVTVNAGDVTITANPNSSDENYKPAAVNVQTFGEATTNVTVGEIHAEGTGIDAETNFGGLTSVTAGDIFVKDGLAIDATATFATTEITAGDIDAAVGVYAMAGSMFATRSLGFEGDGEGGGVPLTTVTVNTGDITADEQGLMLIAQGDGAKIIASTDSVSVTDAEEGTTGITAMSWDGGSISIQVDGDVSSKGMAGLVLVSDEGGEIDAYVDGTVSGKQAGIVVPEGMDTEDVTITAWKVELNENGHAVEARKQDEIESEDTFIRESETAKAVEKKINYIIKVEQPQAGATLSATGKNGAALQKSHDQDVANEGDSVYLKVNLSAGYTLTGAFNGDNQRVPLLRDASGNYYVVVPKGGGVYLSVTVAQTAEEEENPVQLELVPQKAAKKKSLQPVAQASGIEMKVLKSDAEGASYELTLHIPAGGFPEGFTVKAQLPQTGGVADTLKGAPTTEGLKNGELCTFSRNGSEIVFNFYQQYTDESNNQPGLQPGARKLVLKFDTTHAADWPEGTPRVLKLTALAGNGKDTLELQADLDESGAPIKADWKVKPVETASK